MFHPLITHLRQYNTVKLKLQFEILLHNYYSFNRVALFNQLTILKLAH